MIKKIAPILLLCLVFLSCGKTNQGTIPYVQVNFSAPLSDPRLSRLSVVGGAVTIDGYGLCGLIIYHSPTTGYVAYDRCSSYMPENRCAVTLDSPTLTATDPCSGSKFSLDDGSPVKAPATRYLRSYSVNVSINQIFVSN
ncbi:Rieske (2Fe-2S) protein [Mucilaginibacter arboris]|uniref:Rieske domain-containing protein n=1 Tax=Mucilaginibacter arboris TaxID=2682090 RepID=A0A7K1T1T6_9SPHI|nr:hypothetical protein [Mucilaginibacter arboris]MVN23250.1 hypothetical protein [Mucilaginibacter arboris]